MPLCSPCTTMALPWRTPPLCETGYTKRLRTFSAVTLGAPPNPAGIVRGGLKTLTLYLFFPVGMIATLATLFFNKRRQMGHDLMSRTAVVDEKFINHEA